MAILDLLLYALFPAALVVAALSDVATYRIPNALTAALAVTFPVVALGAGLGLDTIGWHVLAGGAALVIGVFGFALGLFGAGDAKLLAGAVLWLGLESLGTFLMATVFTGGALAVAILLFRRVPLPASIAAQRWVSRLHDPRLGVPYGVAIAAGGLLVYPGSVMAQAFSVY